MRSGPTITLTEAQRQAEILRFKSMRERPRILYSGAPSMLGDALAAVCQRIVEEDADADAAFRAAIERQDAIEGERKRYARFRARWGKKFRHSIIGRSLVAWQMHVCDLPVFELLPERKDGSRPAPRRLLKTPAVREACRWFARRLDVTQRFAVCVEARSEAAIERQIRRKR